MVGGWGGGMRWHGVDAHLTTVHGVDASGTHRPICKYSPYRERYLHRDSLHTGVDTSARTRR